MLIVTGTPLSQIAPNDLPKITNADFCDFRDLSDRFLKSTAPQIILAPLTGAMFDILDLAAVLCQLHYKGALRALVPPLPNTAMILQEVRDQFPQIDFDLFEIPDKTR